MHDDAAFRQRFAARWKQLHEREFSVAAIHGLIDENVRTLGDARREMLPAGERSMARISTGFPLSKTSAK
jgi:hypothetical protein